MNSGRKSLLWLVAIFVAPIIIGSLLFFNLDKLGVERASVNYGTLIQPAFPAKVEDLMTNNQATKREDIISKKWTMLYVETDECDQACVKRLQLIKRVRLLMNEKMRRVRIAFVSSESSVNSIDKKEFHNLVLAYINTGTSSFIKQLPDLEKKPIYLLDPLGNLMMYYPQENLEIKKMIKDLLKLLKYSRLG